MSSDRRVLVLDHRDSFVFMLADHFARVGAEVRTLRTSIELDVLERDLDDYRPDLVVLSPGPGHPGEAGVMLPFLKTRPAVAVLGVCLGHQALAVAEGGDVGRGEAPVHGKQSAVEHDGDPLFDGVPAVFQAGRYHSLSVRAVPDAFRVVARARGAGAPVMAMRHRKLPQLGLQFHPESVLTPYGARLLNNVLERLPS
ncbi:MAG: aminodeoxychorismate/anthranilate synthase component II [Planctomycetota bacterium]